MTDNATPHPYSPPDPLTLLPLSTHPSTPLLPLWYLLLSPDVYFRKYQGGHTVHPKPLVPSKAYCKHPTFTDCIIMYNAYLSWFLHLHVYTTEGGMTYHTLVGQEVLLYVWQQPAGVGCYVPFSNLDMHYLTDPTCGRRPFPYTTHSTEDPSEDLAPVLLITPAVKALSCRCSQAAHRHSNILFAISIKEGFVFGLNNWFTSVEWGGHGARDLLRVKSVFVVGRSHRFGFQYLRMAICLMVLVGRRNALKKTLSTCADGQIPWGVPLKPSQSPRVINSRWFQGR